MTAKLTELKKAINYIRGITFKPTDIVEPGSQDSVVCMRTKNVQTFLEQSDLIAVNQSFVKRKEQFIKDGDLLISSANSWNLVGKVCYVENLKYQSTAGGFISVLRVNPDLLDSRFFYYWASSPRSQHYFRLCGRQTTNISNLDRNRFLNLEIPLPPIAEQKRIAAILDKADAVRRKRREAIRLTEELLRSVFLDMFGDPVTNPKGWELLELKDLISIPLQNGAYFPKSQYVEDTSGIEMIHMSDAFRGTVERGNLKRVVINESDLKKYSLHQGDILIARRSLTYEGAAKPCLIEKIDDPLIFESSLIRVRLNIDCILPTFFFMYMTEPRARSFYVFPFVTRSTISGINQSALEKIKILVPPIDDQVKFSRFYEKRLNLISQFRSGEIEKDNLFNSLLQRAFTGNL